MKNSFCNICKEKIKVKYKSTDTEHGVMDGYYEYGHRSYCLDYEKEV